MNSSSLAHLYSLLDRIAAIENEMRNGGWSFHMVSLRHDAIRCLVEAAEDRISMPTRRRAKFGLVPYIDLTQDNQREIANG